VNTKRDFKNPLCCGRCSGKKAHFQQRDEQHDYADGWAWRTRRRALRRLRAASLRDIARDPSRPNLRQVPWERALRRADKIRLRLGGIQERPRRFRTGQKGCGNGPTSSSETKSLMQIGSPTKATYCKQHGCYTLQSDGPRLPLAPARERRDGVLTGRPFARVDDNKGGERRPDSFTRADWFRSQRRGLLQLPEAQIVNESWRRP